MLMCTTSYLSINLGMILPLIRRGERKVEIEDELKVVGQKQQNLEVGEEKSLGREEVLQKQIKELMTKLTYANARSENAEMDIGRLNY